MGINKNIAANILQYKQDHKLSTVELAAELHLSVSTTQEYLNGNGNPRANTLEMLAQQMGISVVELISSPSPGVEWAQSVIHAANELAMLPPARREKGIRLFAEMVELWSGESCIHIPSQQKGCALCPYCQAGPTKNSDDYASPAI